MADAKPAEGAESATVKSDNSKLILLAVIGLLMMILVGGGVAGFFLLRDKATDTAEVVAADSAEEGESKASDSKASDKAKKEKNDKAKKAKDTAPKGPALYVSLEPPFVVNFAAGQPARFLQITAQIMTRDPATSKVLKDNDPLLRNDLLMLFATQTYEGISAAEGKETLRKQALDTVRRVVKAEGGTPENVEAVYFTSIVMQ